MSSVAIAVGVVLFLLLFFLMPLVLLGIVNIGIPALVAYKLAKRFLPRLILFVSISALVGLNVRMLALFQGNPNEVRTEISTKAIVGPHEKLVLDSDSEYVYFRRRTDPPSYGMRNDWSIGFIPVKTVYEQPKRILSVLGIGYRTGSEGKTVLRIRTRENFGVMTVFAEVLATGKVVSSYTHTVRKSYPLEEFDYYGTFRPGDVRAAFLVLTQNSFWAARHELVPAEYRPLERFITAAVAQGGYAEDGSPITPAIDGLNRLDILQHVKADIDLTLLTSADLQSVVWRSCDGQDVGKPFTAVAPETVFWKDKDLPSMTIPRSTVDGYSVMASTVSCDKEANRFWLGAYHVGRLNLWKYHVDFSGRSLRLERWLQAEASPEAKQSFDALRPRVLRIGTIHESIAELFVVQMDTHSARPFPVSGYRIEMALK